jgi:hypothetical protein
MKVAESMTLINLPSAAATDIAFEFTSSIGGGFWDFVFKWANGVWNGWATLPSGEVRPFGCVPNVIDWSGFVDYGVVILANKNELGKADLAATGTSLVVIGWA